MGDTIERGALTTKLHVGAWAYSRYPKWRSPSLQEKDLGVHHNHLVEKIGKLKIDR